jgi:murein L,D-transpeptidase YcbB/YkuD
VNIPEFLLRVFEGSDTAFTMPVIVGKEGAATLQFGGSMDQIVFNPYWNIPQSIAVNEILPAAKKDPGYLKKKRIERNGGTDEAPRYRQLPGPDNSLGLVKFLFPNNYDIYLHDTPAKDAFQQGDRALSHGCIRLSDAPKLAQYLLRNEASWSPEAVTKAMDGKEEKKVALKEPVPVRITYLTATVGAGGQLHFFNDIYRLDEKQYRAMFRMTTATPTAARPAAAADTTTAARPL